MSQEQLRPVKVGLLGIGTVGGGTFTVLSRNQEEIRRRAGRGIEIAMVADLNTELAKCADAGISANDAITEALNSGWQGFKASWVIKRLAEAAPAAQSRHHGFADRDYTAGLAAREDGTYAI